MAKEKRDAEPKVKGNSFGASGFTLGILSIVSLGAIGLLMSALGFLFCMIQQRGKKTKLGKAGLIICAIGFVFSIIWIVYLAPMLSTYINQLQTIS